MANTTLDSRLENLSDGSCAMEQVKLHSKSWSQYAIAINNQKIMFDKDLVRSWSVIGKQNLE